MGRHLARWRVALRTARRLAMRSRGRTLLIVLLISVPAAGGAFLDTYVHTQQLSPQERTTRLIGQADAWVLVTDQPRIVDIAVGGEYLSWTTQSEYQVELRDPATVRAADFLPAGSRLVSAQSARTAEIAFEVGDRAVRSRVATVQDDPILAGIYRYHDGRAPNELAVTSALAQRLGLGVGDTAQLGDAGAATIVGVYVHPDALSTREALAGPGWLPVAGDGTGPAPSTGFFVELPAGAKLTVADVNRAAESGVVLKPRDAFLHPGDWTPPGSSSGGPSNDGLIGGLVTAGLAAIAVVLLAGTAFAVGVRRQLRDAALILAVGGRPSDVRRVVLAQGAVIGLAGTVVGTAIGVGTVAAFRSLLERSADMEFGSLLVSLPELGAIAGIAFASGVLAALAPAIGAGRLSVVDALAGRFSSPRRAGRRLPVVGAATAVVGLVVALGALWRWRSIAGNALADADPDPTPYVLAMVAGFMLLITGAALTTPLLLSGMSRVCGPLPVSLRIAVRDAARQRHRTAPVVASVLVAVAGSVVIAVALASLDERGKRDYVPYSPMNVALLQGDDLDADPAVEQARILLGGSQVDMLHTLSSDSASLHVEPVAGCTAKNVSAAGGIAVDGPGIESFVGVRHSEARAIMATGKAVVLSPCLVDGQGLIHILRYDYARGTPETTELTLSAAYLDPRQTADWSTPTVFVSAGTAAAFHGFVSTASQAIVIGPTPTEGQVEQAQDALGSRPHISVERGYQSSISPLFVGIMVASGLITIAGVAVAVGLDAAESRGDLATLAAVGASPGRRRTFAMGQAALVALLGGVVGCVVGCIIGFIAVSATGGELPLVVPVLPLLVIGVGVPIVAILGAGAATRSRLPMVRRLA